MIQTAVPPSAPDPTRLRLLEAAGEVFTLRGYRDATIREICARAAANIAAVNYHFGGKQGLYSAVLRYVDDAAHQRHPFPDASSLPPPQRLERFVIQFMQKVFDTDRPAWHQRLLAREMVEPTFALDDLVSRNIRPRAQMLQSIVRDLLGPGATPAQVQRAAASVVGQCLFYWHCRPMIDRLMPAIGDSPASIRAIAAHIACFSLAGIAPSNAGYPGSPSRVPPQSSAPPGRSASRRSRPASRNGARP